MSLDWVAFDSSKFFISLIISFKLTLLNENGKAKSGGICFFLSLAYLDGFQIFIACNTGSWWRLIFGGCLISKFDTIFGKYSN